jgi:threonyl-tRNA synthetase
MIHRAIQGSFERFMAILIEHFGGKWPFWLSPRQILVVPIMPSANDYTLEVQALFRAKGFHADVDVSGNTIKKKILMGQTAQYNYIFVVGADEKENRAVNIRDRDDQSSQQRGETISLEKAIERMEELRKSKALPVFQPIAA